MCGILKFPLSRKKLISCRQLCNFSTFIFLTALFTSTLNEFLYKLHDHKLWNTELSFHILLNAVLICCQIHNFFFQGWCFAHSLIAIIVSYLLLQIVGPSMVTVGLTFFFNMVSVDVGHFKGHRLPKGTHLYFRARLFKGQLQ